MSTLRFKAFPKGPEARAAQPGPRRPQETGPVGRPRRGQSRRQIVLGGAEDDRLRGEEIRRILCWPQCWRRSVSRGEPLQLAEGTEDSRVPVRIRAAPRTRARSAAVRRPRCCLGEGIGSKADVPGLAHGHLRGHAGPKERQRRGPYRARPRHSRTARRRGGWRPGAEHLDILRPKVG